MKCYLVDGQGIQNIALAERPITSNLGEYEVLVDVKACALNYRDLLVAKGKYGGKPGEFPPIIALSDMAGKVKAVGSKVSEFKPDDRVLNAPFRHWPAGKLRSSWASTFVGGNGVDGVLAEQVVYPEDALVKIPEDLNFNEAATLTIAGLTAWAAVVTHGKIRPGEWLLLHGTGGVSSFAAQLGQALGAKMIMTTSSPEKAEYVKKSFGITATVNYHEPDWPQQVHKITQGCGVDVVVDVVGGETLTKSLQICNYAARVAVIGLLSGNETVLHTRELLKHQIQLRGIFMESTEELRAFVKAVESIKLKPVVNKVFPFQQAKEAYQYLDSQKHVGKVVISLENS